MTELLAKARNGRTNAIARLPSQSAELVSKPKSDTRHDLDYDTGPIPFVSKRAQSHTNIWVH